MALNNNGVCVHSLISGICSQHGLPVCDQCGEEFAWGELTDRSVKCLSCETLCDIGILEGGMCRDCQ